MTDDLATIRRWYAEDLRLRAPVLRNLAIVEAFATVPRERFLGAPPWQILADVDPRQHVAAPDHDPRWINHDVLVAIDAERKLNNGLPSFWARNFDHLEIRRGERVLQVGAATGYYTAVLAELVGPEGRVVAVEHDEELAARARANLADWPWARAVHGDGRTYDAGEVDIIVVFAGSTHPAPLWLDRLAARGCLLMPLTDDHWWGFLLLATRGRIFDAKPIMLPEPGARNGFDATSIGGVGIFPCIGGRDEAAAKRQREACMPFGPSPRDVPITALHRGDPPEDAERVWYHGPGFWLERKQASA